MAQAFLQPRSVDGRDCRNFCSSRAGSCRRELPPTAPSPSRADRPAPRPELLAHLRQRGAGSALERPCGSVSFPPLGTLASFQPSGPNTPRECERRAEGWGRTREGQTGQVRETEGETGRQRGRQAELRQGVGDRGEMGERERGRGRGETCMGPRRPRMLGRRGVPGIPGAPDAAPRAGVCLLGVGEAARSGSPCSLRATVSSGPCGRGLEMRGGEWAGGLGTGHSLKPQNLAEPGAVCPVFEAPGCLA